MSNAAAGKDSVEAKPATSVIRVIANLALPPNVRITNEKHGSYNVADCVAPIIIHATQYPPFVSSSANNNRPNAPTTAPKGIKNLPYPASMIRPEIGAQAADVRIARVIPSDISDFDQPRSVSHARNIAAKT